VVTDNSSQAYLNDVANALDATKPRIVAQDQSKKDVVVVEEIKSPTNEEQGAFEKSLKFEAIPMEQISNVPEHDVEAKVSFEKSLGFIDVDIDAKHSNVLSHKIKSVPSKIATKSNIQSRKIASKPNRLIKKAVSKTFEGVMDSAYKSASNTKKSETVKTQSDDELISLSQTTPPTELFKSVEQVVRPPASDNVKSLLGTENQTIEKYRITDKSFGDNQQKQKVMLVSYSLREMRIIGKSDSCQGITGRLGGGVDFQRAYKISASIIIPNDYGSKRCKREKQVLEERVASACNALSATQLILPEYMKKRINGSCLKAKEMNIKKS
jgi:hypothetical protein